MTSESIIVLHVFENKIQNQGIELKNDVPYKVAALYYW
jgi:hypothetical protein